jgi:hypothetical protein
MGAIEKIQPQAVTLDGSNGQPTSQPMTLLEMAVKQNANIDTIERLVALQQQMQARDAEMEFNDAMNRAQMAIGRVAADLTNPQTHSKYASYAALDRKVRPIYTKEGLALSFDTGDSPSPDYVRVLCYVSRGGHTRTYHADVPADGKGAKGGDVMTKTHAFGAGTSYGMRYLLKMIFNIAVGEEDNDGNGQRLDDLNERLEYIENCRDLDELQQVFKAGYKMASEMGDINSAKALVAAKDKKKAELSRR